MTKRARFIAVSLMLSVGFILINFLESDFKFLTIGGLGVLTLIFFVWSLWEGLGKNATLLTLVLPCLYTVGVGLFWFLLPASLYARFPIVFLYGLGIYALSLTANIFTVSAIRTIALVRAARGVGFVLTLVTAFLLYDAVFSIRSDILISTALISIISFPLFLQGLWVSNLDRKISLSLVSYSALLTLAMSEISLMLYFWPVSVVVGSLFMTVSLYVLLGLGQAQLEGRLFVRTAREYLSVGIIVFVAMFFATHWG